MYHHQALQKLYKAEVEFESKKEQKQKKEQQLQQSLQQPQQLQQTQSQQPLQQEIVIKKTSTRKARTCFCLSSFWSLCIPIFIVFILFICTKNVYYYSFINGNSLCNISFYWVIFRFSRVRFPLLFYFFGCEEQLIVNMRILCGENKGML